MMKPGALVLFIDNAAGGFTEVIERAGKKFNFQMKSKSHLRHKLYSNMDLKVKRFGHPSCFQTRVTILLMQKPGDYKTKKRSRSHSSQGRRISASKVLLREVQNENLMPSQLLVATQEKVDKTLLYTDAEHPSQSNCFNQSIYAPKKNTSLSSDMQNIKSAAKGKINKSLMLSEPQRPYCFNQSVYVPERNTWVSSSKVNIRSLLSGKSNKSSMPYESQHPPQPYCFNQSIYAPKRNTSASSDMQNIKSVSSGKINQSLVPNETQCPPDPNCFSQSIYALKKNTSASSDVQSSKSASNGKIHQSLMSNETHHSSQTSCSAQSILGSKKNVLLSENAQNTRKTFSKSRGDINTSLQRNSHITSSTSTSVANHGLHPPASNTCAAKINHLIHQNERYYSRTISTSLSPRSDISSRPLITPSSDQAPYPESVDNLDNNCCTCCNIS